MKNILFTLPIEENMSIINNREAFLAMNRSMKELVLVLLGLKDSLYPLINK
jgi:hypothetical protein